jgi:putative PEP-CTERM system histidine kinase
VFDFAAIGYGATAVLYALLALLLLVGWRERFQGLAWLISVTASAIWAVLAALHAMDGRVSVELVWAAEVVRNLLWTWFLLRLLQPLAEGNALYSRVLGYVRLGSLVLGLLLLLVLTDIPLRADVSAPELQREFSLMGQLLYAVLGMALVEQLFRNTPVEQRWGIKYLCFGLGVIFAYDFYLYTDALLFHRLDIDIWSARGAVNAMAVPMLAITAARNPDWSLPVLLSRRMVFHSTTLLGAGVYMLLMALAGYYIRLYGGEWGTVLQIAFLFGAGMLLAALLFSGQMRARAKVFLNKHFFSYRYDYREEWLRLMNLLAGERSELPLHERVIWAISEIVESPGGLLWLVDDKANYRCVSHFNMAVGELPAIHQDHPLPRFMTQRQWIVDLDECRGAAPSQEELDIPPWLLDDDFWLLVPLMQDQRMLGFVLLSQPRAPQALNWENRDLLKTAGMQAASYVALYQAADALADARQFEGFNRLSAFVIHDLKNLIAQLSLVAKNAAKHKHNPAFIDDAVGTIENSVDKMNRLMAQLKSADVGGFNDHKEIDLVEELRAMVDSRSSAKPKPQLELQTEHARVLAHEDRLSAVFGHVLQNALDATPADGWIKVVLRVSGENAIVEFRDNGVGMDEDFVKNRLFRPFDSTKGLTGMGIGAYECREVVQASGGQVVVDSGVGKGTVFRILLPLKKA